MAMTCTICRLSATDAELLESIDADLVSGVPLRAIAKRHLGDASRYQALGRHRRLCMRERLIKAGLTRIEQTRSRFDEFDVRLDAAYAVAMQKKDSRGAVAATAEQRKQLEFLHKLDGDLEDRPGGTVDELMATIRGLAQELFSLGGRAAVERGVKRAQIERARLADVLEATDPAALLPEGDEAA